MTTNPATGPCGSGSGYGSGPRELYGRLCAYPYLVDTLIAVAALGATLIGAATEPQGQYGWPHFSARGLSRTTVLLAVLACAVLVLRRRAPMPVLCITGLVSVVGLALGTTADTSRRASIVVAAIIALYTVSNRTDRLTSWKVGAVTVGVLTTAAMLFGAGPWYAQENLGIFAWTGLAVAAGEAVRTRRAFIDAMTERAERAERTREVEARRRVAEERMRIARELHDVVAHHIALVNVQAGVASHVMDQRPDQAKQALAHVRQASRHALDELQTTVGLLRQSGESAAPTEPAPGLGVLDELVEDFVRAGLAVHVEAPALAAGEEDGGGPQLPSAVDLTAYRVVQEALTNVQKHVGTGASVQVRIVRDGGKLAITVVDDGAGGPADLEDAERHEAGHGGHGLLGMRERAAALGGSCETGPAEEGGFRVHVRLPLQAAARRGGEREEPEAEEEGPPQEQQRRRHASHMPHRQRRKCGGGQRQSATGATNATDATDGANAAPATDGSAAEAVGDTDDTGDAEDASRDEREDPRKETPA